jgi:hypothetical protein
VRGDGGEQGDFPAEGRRLVPSGAEASLPVQDTVFKASLDGTIRAGRREKMSKSADESCKVENVRDIQIQQFLKEFICDGSLDAPDGSVEAELLE